MDDNLHRGLKSRHIQLIAIGGAIGVGLFLGSSTAIKTAGPALVISYLIGGLAMYVVLRAMGELAVEHPVSGSFSAYAHKYVNPLSGYMTGWSYWFMWIVTCMAEITAAGVYMVWWFPDTPKWAWALAALVIMMIVNLISVKSFGEFEFWFAMIKVITIIAMIIIGILMIVFGFWNNGEPIGISNLWSHGGFFAKGLDGPVLALGMVAFAYLGIELIGVTAGEAQNPEKAIPSAIDKTLWRVLIFYVGALLVIMSIFPWNEIGTNGSPFVLTFEKMGIKTAAGIINFVVLTAALSSCNSGLYSTGRMLHGLATQNRAPKMFAKLSRSKVPVNGILISAAILLFGVVLNYFVPEKAFLYVTSIGTGAAIWVWSISLIAQLKYRKTLSSEQVRKLKYPMIFYPFSSYIVLAFFALVIVALWLNPDSRIAVYVCPVWFIILIISYYAQGFHKLDKQSK